MHRRALYRTGPPLATVVVALALASCGGGGSSSGAATSGAIMKPSASKTAASSTKRCVRTSPRYARRSANACGSGAGNGGASGCQERIGEFVDRMDDLRRSLLAGLSYAEYVVRVRAIRDAYEAIPVERLGVGCLDGAAGDAEAAFNQYLRAANTWGECAGTEGCAASAIEGRLQRRWRIASQSLDAAETG
jgi:hypothetical protein